MRRLEQTIDDIDAKILNILQRNARTAQAEIARVVGLAPSAVLERMRKLEVKGILQGYAALVEPRALGLGQLAFVAVRTSTIGAAEDNIGNELVSVPEVLEAHHVAGEDCFLLKIRTRDAQHLGELLRRRLGAIPGVVSTRTTMVLETFKETPRLPMPGAAEEAA
jgi:Lrp/AsnC family transcriptional regulator, leucine-responsive regulatory protein